MLFYNCFMTDTNIQYRIPYAVRTENSRLWNENEQLKKQIKEMEKERIKLGKEICSLKEDISKRDNTIREMNQEILRLMIKNEEMKIRK